MLLYNEFSQFKCSETYLDLSPVKCAVLCNGTTLITTPCKNGKRNNTIYTKVFMNNTCSLKAVKTTESHCSTQCPKSIIIESKVCIRNQKTVYHITFENVKGKCVKRTNKLKTINCTSVTGMDFFSGSSFLNNILVCPQPRLSKTSCVNGQRTVLNITYRLNAGQCKQVVQRMQMENCSSISE